MKSLKNGLHKSWSIPRRDFLKYAGLLAGLYCTRGWFRGANSNALAQGNPKVVSVHDSTATNWDYVTGYYWQYIDQTVVNSMVARGVKTLTGKSTTEEAWSDIIPYQSGDAVVIKVNFNNAGGCGDRNNNIDAYPEVVNAIIDGLISIGIPPNKIWITDPSRTVLNRFINGIDNPDVWFYDATGHYCSSNYYLTNYVAANSPHASSTTHPPGDVVRPAQVFVDAAHLINVPLLKGHGGGHMTLGMKNHYGSVTFSGSNPGSERMRMHQYLEPEINPDLEKSILADIGNNPHIRDKTRLILGDGLFGHPVTNWQSISRWQIFNNDDPNILFFGTDPIATDSVMSDYIIEEQDRLGYNNVIHSCLHHGAALGLGIHDHWDSFEKKQYSLIDYINVHLDLVPDIKANGSDGPLTIPPGTDLRVTIALDPGIHDGENADWWVVANTPFGWFYYNVSTDSWIPGFVVTHQGPLFDLAPREVLNRSLPTGTYIFHFGVDLLMNGSLDFSQLNYDSVDVNIE